MLKMASGHIVISPMASSSQPPYSNPISCSSPCAHLTCQTMPGSTTLFQTCIILLGGQKTLAQKFSPSQQLQEHHLHKVAFAGRLSLFTQPALFPQVICLQKKGQQKKGLSSDSSTL